MGKQPDYLSIVIYDLLPGIRIAKNGQNLHQNFRGLVEEITHPDLDILVGKRGSFNSTLGNIYQKGRGHWAIYYTSLQSFIISFSLN